MSAIKRKPEGTNNVLTPLFDALLPTDVNMGMIFSSLSGPWIRDDIFQEQPALHLTQRQKIANADLDKLFASNAFRDLIAERLSGAVKVPTVTYDGMKKVGEDPRWDIFYQFATYLEKTFPKVYKTLGITAINEHAFLYTWMGSDTSLKPLVFMAHSDVVPAESTADRWTHPPFSGYYDGSFIWGRGSADDKCNVIAKLSAFEALLEADFKPTRTVILSLGFDEEGGANQSYGARCLADRLLEIYGQDGIEMILDEGGIGVEEHWGTNFALPATAEKGFINVLITLDMSGGHSSTPPDHTAIGYLSQLIQKIEDNQFPFHLTDKNPTKTYLQTAARHSKTMPKDLRSAILNPRSIKKVIEYLNHDQSTRARIRTTTAVDVIRGGSKSNALPESTTVLVNHRIAVEESVQDVKTHYRRIIDPWAQSLGLKFQDIEIYEEKFIKKEMVWKSSNAKLTLTTLSELEPSPISSPLDPRFTWLAGALQTVFGEDVIVAPVLEGGNTDTKFYWKLSPQIYRINPYSGKWDPRGWRIHTVDERMPVDGMLEMVRFYSELIRVVDEQRLSTSFKSLGKL